MRLRLSADNDACAVSHSQGPPAVLGMIHLPAINALLLPVENAGTVI